MLAWLLVVEKFEPAIMNCEAFAYGELGDGTFGVAAMFIFLLFKIWERKKKQI